MTHKTTSLRNTGGLIYVCWRLKIFLKSLNQWLTLVNFIPNTLEHRILVFQFLSGY